MVVFAPDPPSHGADRLLAFMGATETARSRSPRWATAG